MIRLWGGRFPVVESSKDHFKFTNDRPVFRNSNFNTSKKHKHLQYRLMRRRYQSAAQIEIAAPHNRCDITAAEILGVNPALHTC